MVEIGQKHIAYEHNLCKENKQHDIEQNQIISVPLPSPPKLLNWTEVLEVSACDVEDHDIPISAPPFPFKQGWDNRAKKESKARQRVQRMQTAGFYMALRDSYDGAEDGDKSPSAEHSDVVSSIDSEERSLLYDGNGYLIQRELEAPSERSESESGVSKFSDVDESISEAEGSGSQDIQVFELDSDKDHQLAVPELNIQCDEGSAQSVFSQSVDSDVAMVGDEDGYQSPSPVEEPDFTQRLPEMPRSQSPSFALEEDTDTATASSTPIAQLSLKLHVEEHKAAQLNAENGQLTDQSSLRQPKPVAAQFDQLATPNNTQEEHQTAQFSVLQDEMREEKPSVELPLSPQNTQELQDEEPLGANKEQEKISSGPSVLQPKIHLGECETDTNLTTPISEETRRRRSSRLSGKMPLLGKDPSEIVSPYFTPKRAIQDSKQDQNSSSSLHQSLSPSSKPRDNVVVLIPLPTEKRSEVNIQQRPVTPTTLTSTKTSLARRPADGKGFTTPHSYYPSLSSMPHHFHDQVDILAVASSVPKQPQRAKIGQKDYYLSLKLVDSSCNAGDPLSVQLFRPYRNALPSCARGDVLLLRDMKVQTCPAQGNRRKVQEDKGIDDMMLLSTDSSAWALFKFPPADSVSAAYGRPNSRDGSARSPAKRGTPVKMEIQVNGPPVEFGAEERAFARGLYKWWNEEGRADFPHVHSKPGQKMKRKGKEMLKELNTPEETLHEHELRDGMAYGDMISPRPLHEHFHRNENFHVEDHESSLHEHELRDGMAYGDTISQLPLHEHHQHDHDVEHSHIHDFNAPQHGESDTEAEDDKSSLHEHELRDGMTYSDTLTSKPINRHFHLHEDQQDGQLRGTDHPVRNDHDVSTSLSSDEADHSCNLRNGISYGNTNPNRESTLIPTPKSPKPHLRSRQRIAAQVPREQSESESEVEDESESVGEAQEVH